MKRSPLKRKSPPKHKPPRRLKSAKADAKYLARVRELACVLGDVVPCKPQCAACQCNGPTEAHHAGRRGVGQKCADSEAVPMCRNHHRQLTDHVGLFHGVRRELRRLWQDGWIRETQAKLGVKP